MIHWLEKHRVASAILAILITIEIFYFSTLQGGTGTGGIPFVSTAYHFIVFFLFSFFLLMAIKGKNKLKTKQILIVLAISIAHAILDEVHQSFVPFRDAGIRDVITDSLGIFSAMIVAKIANRKSNQ
jgi:VanZ family protein